MFSILKLREVDIALEMTMSVSAYQCIHMTVCLQEVARLPSC